MVIGIAENIKTSAPPPAVFSSVDPAAKVRTAVRWFDDQVAKAAINGPHAIVATLYPELARHILDNNPGNRPVSRRTVATWKRDMASGEWALNGETIIISKEGLLNDGQHRLMANIEYGEPIKCCFFFGAERDSRLTVNRGKIRTSGDYFSMEGIKGGNHLGHACRLVYLITTLGRVSSHSEHQPTKSQVRNMFDSCPGISESLDFVGWKRVGTASVGILAAFHFLFAKLDKQQADGFISALKGGTNLAHDNPAFVLRERLVADKARKRRGEGEACELIIRAWNMRRQGRTAARIQIGADFPRII